MTHHPKIPSLRDQRGTLYEIPILIVVLLVVGAIFFGNLAKLGFAKALLKAAIVLAFIAGPFLGLFIIFWVVGSLMERFSKKPPQDPK